MRFSSRSERAAEKLREVSADSVAEVRGLVWLVGESNPYGSDPGFALYPEPSGCTGDRLRRLWGGSAEDYLKRFERRNLLCGPGWSAPLARVAATDLLAEARPEDALVLLGARVAVAFGLEFAALRRGEVEGKSALVLPHPSGRNRMWQTPGLWERAGAALREVAPLAPAAWVTLYAGRRYRRSGALAVCLECGWVREGTISWEQAHDRHHADSLPRCEHGHALRDGAGERLEPLCGCLVAEVQ